MSILRTSILLLSVAVLALPAAAQAAPSTYQQFEAKLIGKAGSAKKPGSVGTYLHPFHVIKQDPSCAAAPNLAACRTNTFGLNSVAGGALAEPSFATVTATIFLPKELKLATTGFPTCSYENVFDAQNAKLCPKGSMIGAGEAQGYVRSPSNTTGAYVVVVKPEVKVFILDGKNTIALRVYSSLSKTAIIPGVIKKTSGSNAKQYGSQIDFSLPKGLIDVSGLISQLSTFDSTIKAAKNKSGKPLQGLTGCPKNRKLTFGYQAQYNVGLDRTTAPFYIASGAQYSINHVSPIMTSVVPCKK